MNKNQILFLILISSILFSGIWCQYGDDYCWDNCYCSDSCWTQMNNCYGSSCQTQIDAFNNEIDSNNNYDFSLLFDYQMCFVPCYYGKENQEVYDYQGCYDKCSGIISIDILFQTCYTEMINFFQDYKDQIIVDSTTGCGGLCNDIPMTDIQDGWYGSNYDKDFVDYQDVYDCYDCLDSTPISDIYLAFTSYADLKTCIENQSSYLDTYWLIYSFIYGYDITSAVYSYQDDYYDDTYYSDCYSSCTCDDACWAYYDSCQETICQTEYDAYKTEISNSQLSVSKLIDLNLCLMPCYDGVNDVTPNNDRYAYSKCNENCYGSISIPLTYETCYTQVKEYIQEFKQQIILTSCSSVCENMVVDYDSFSQELKNETYEYLYDSGCYDCIYGVIDDYILNSVAGAVLNDCVQQFDYIADLYYLYYSAIEGYYFEWSIYESYYYDETDYYDDISSDGTDYSCYANCQCDQECWDSQNLCYEVECLNEYLDYYNEYTNENQMSITKLFDYSICFTQCYYDSEKTKLQEFNKCNSNCSGTLEIDNLVYNVCLDKLIAYFEAFNNIVVKQNCPQKCENIPLSYDENYDSAFQPCFDCIDSNWVSFENDASYKDFNSCLQNDTQVSKVNNQEVAKAFIMGGGEVQKIDLGSAIETQNTSTTNTTVNSKSTQKASYIAPMIFIMFLLYIIATFI